MTARANFDLLDSPLESGTTLIEASAGTGKTYTIVGIVLRLILEQGLSIEQILVTTYTELATAELRNRIRQLIRDTLDALTGSKSPNELVESLRARHQSSPDAVQRLRLALQGFDEAPIYTIHGFCQRMLRDRAFESGALFDAELITEQKEILREIVDDFWRGHFYAGEPIVTTLALRNKLTLARLRQDLDQLVNKPTLKVIPPVEQEFAQAQEELIAHWRKIQTCWESGADEVRQIFAKNTWAKGTHGDQGKMAAYLADLARCLGKSVGSAEQVDCLRLFASSAVRKNTRAAHSPPEHPLFDHCEKLLAAEQKLIVRLEAAFFAWARLEMKRRKVQRNVFFFDDLLTRLDESLGADGGNRLALAIRERFPAALIDEFQDTDPIQYSIFRRIYGGSDARIFFIGDPKQAIYGFRGADVFTYLAASEAADHPFTLGKNWRSENSLVRAINAFFGLRPDAFVLSGIDFRPVDPAGMADKEPLKIGGAKEPSFRLWLLEAEKPITNTDARELLPHSVATEVARLLNSDARIGRRRLEPRDIAVLVSTNPEAQIVQQALTDLHIPSVVYSAANVFQSPEADELLRILAAVVEPAHEKRVRAALTTDAFGLTGEALEGLGRDDRGWESRLLDFQKYHQLWREHGFIRMLRTVMVEQHVRARLLSYPDGERRLTNMMHLAELLHRMCVDGRLGMTGLLKRLAEEMASMDLSRTEEHELRLERDEEAVRIVTVHKSKGLEYDVVFCPFSWSDPKINKEDSVTFHRGNDLVLDLEKDEAHKLAQQREALADSVRRLYVALTRARHRCYFVWGNFRGGQKSAPAHLLGPWQQRRVAALTGEKSFLWEQLPEPSGDLYLPGAGKINKLQPRRFERTIDRSYNIGSFTRLISGHDKEPESPDYDSAELVTVVDFPIETEAVATGMFSFPRGTAPGTCLHHILQEIDFSNLTDLSELVRRKLHVFSLSGFEDIVCEMVRRTISVPLEVDEPEFTLSRLPRKARLSELEFYFPVRGVTRERLVQLLGDQRLQFQPMSGFMKGFIDLIFEHEDRFYIVDWKSNWLGAELESYTSAAMEAEMLRKFYNLQLSIYTVALHRFLRARLPGYDYDQHFGGAFYIFLRGIEPTRPELGVYRARPEAGFVQQLSDLLTHGT